MNAAAYPPAHVPTLTEVIEVPELPLPEPLQPATTDLSPVAYQPEPWLSAPAPTLFDAPPQAEPMAALPAEPALPMAPALPEVTEAQLAQRVLGDVQRQIDSMVDFRMREAMGPILARHSEALVRDLREELALTMRDVVARSVAQEMAKLRLR